MPAEWLVVVPLYFFWLWYSSHSFYVPLFLLCGLGVVDLFHQFLVVCLPGVRPWLWCHTANPHSPPALAGVCVAGCYIPYLLHVSIFGPGLRSRIRASSRLALASASGKGVPSAPCGLCPFVHGLGQGHVFALALLSRSAP
jgi:hypothetical protein